MIHRVSLHIVTWNSRRYLPTCFRSIEEQTFQDYAVLIVDNASRDGTVEYVRERLPQAKILLNRQNLGFARGHNQAIHISQSPFMFVLNPDIILTPTFLERLVGCIENDSRLGSASGKLLKFSFQSGELSEPRLSDTIDTTGLQVLRSRRTINRGEGETDRGQFDHSTDVFGVSAAAALYRRSALVDVQIGNEFFDDDFFAYKEDVDLAWRLRRRGWAARYVPEAIAHHHRGVTGDSRSDARLLRQRQRHSRFINGYSYANHLSMLLKNEAARTLLPDLPWIVFYEFKKFVYLLFFEPGTLRSLGRFVRRLRSLLAKRRFIRTHERVAASTIRTRYFL